MSLAARCRAAVVGLALLTFFPVVTFDFSGWDDRAVIGQNPRLLEPTPEALGWFWTHPEFHLYIPVTQTLWWLTAHLAGTEAVAGARSLAPAAFHGLNLLIHAAAAVGAFELLRRLKFGDAPSALGAGLFAVHPLQTEAVAWAAATKDLLAGALSIAALVCHVESLRDADRPRRRLYLAGTVLFAAALLSKPSAVVVPLLAAVIDLVLLRRPIRQAAIAVGPWLLIALPCVAWTAAIQPGLQDRYVGIFDRLLIAGDALAFYLGKLFWPVRLCFDYGRTPQAVLASSSVYLTAIVPVLLGGTCAWLWRRQRSICAGLLIFAGGVTPVLGLAPFDFQMYSTVGDHYLYLSMLGPAVAVAGILAARPAAQAIALVVIVLLAVLAQRQAWTWRTLESMNRHTISVNPMSWASHHNLAVALSEGNRLEEAHSTAMQALRLRPQDPYVRRTAVMVLLRQADEAAASGRTDDATRLYEQGLAIQPDNPLLLTNLAATLAELGRFEQAIALYERAIAAAPGDSAAARAGIELLRSIRRPAPTTGPN